MQFQELLSPFFKL